MNDKILKFSSVKLINFNASTMNVELLVDYDDQRYLFYGVWLEKTQGWVLTTKATGNVHPSSCFEVINALVGSGPYHRGLESMYVVSIKRLTEEILSQSEGQKIVTSIVAKELQGTCV